MYEIDLEPSKADSRCHDPLAESEVTVTDPNHPLLKGLPATFNVGDELYWFEPDPQGTPIKVLATAHSPSKKQNLPDGLCCPAPESRYRRNHPRPRRRPPRPRRLSNLAAERSPSGRRQGRHSANEVLDCYKFPLSIAWSEG